MYKINNKDVSINIPEHGISSEARTRSPLEKFRPTHYLPSGMRPTNQYQRACVDALLIGAGIQICQMSGGYSLLAAGITSVKNAFEWIWTTAPKEATGPKNDDFCFSRYDSFTYNHCVTKLRECYHFTPVQAADFCSLNITAGLYRPPD